LGRHDDCSFPTQRSSDQIRKVSLCSRGYILKPGKVYLGATLERIGSDRYVTLLLGRSSIGRQGMFLNVNRSSVTYLSLPIRSSVDRKSTRLNSSHLGISH